MKLALLLAVIGLAMVVVAFIDADQASGPPVVRSDYQACVTVRPAPLLRSPKHRLDLRVNEPFNDKGNA